MSWPIKQALVVVMRRIALDARCKDLNWEKDIFFIG